MLLVLVSATTGAVCGFVASSWIRKRKPKKSYAQFESFEVIQQNLWSDAAKATAKADGAKNLEILRAGNLLGKTWPVRISCREANGASGKVIHFIRHGQGFHNSLFDFSSVFEFEVGDISPYHIPEMLDPPLTEIGRQQALRLRGVALQTAPQLVLVSPMSRALMTSNIAYAHLVGKIPFIAHDGCKEKSHAMAADYRRSATMAQADFPNVDFSLVPDKDPQLDALRPETDMDVAQRAYDFMLFIRDRPETEIVVSTHSAWLFNVFNVVMKCDSPEVAEWFANGEMRSVRVSFES
ncbi:unnamed protein product [Cladocopium goreaui]|uniref:Phosphoglycerate mutase-like protein (AtPGM) n=1 Tax=Cladocopium goreaui TaxID=2562237 RepID=A0A9P1C7B3_9DINO|nr:unnamed protein product [Cladocopium goreaui]